MNLTTIALENAFREPGCPLCHLRRRSEQRYLFGLLYENVNDGGTRANLVNSMGMCPAHAWALQAIELENWHDGLGTSIIYRDLASRVLSTLVEHLERNPSSDGDRRARQRDRLGRSGVLGRVLARRLGPPTPGVAVLKRLSPRARCHVCRLMHRLETTSVSRLVGGLAEAEFQSAYAASDGLCLPHLRRALAGCEDAGAVRCLVETAAAHLEPLVRDLGEYVRKYDWNNRQEARHPWEEAAWLRAVAFFSGEAPRPETGETQQRRRNAPIDYRRRKENVDPNDADCAHPTRGD